MVAINYAFREISCKIVFYGPGLSGKTTNLQYIHNKVPGKTRGELISLATDADRTLYFDFLPINLGAIQGFSTKFQLYTVPGQVYYNATRKLVLRGVDGLVFVADSQRSKMDENLESLKNLYDNLEEYGYDPADLPMVIQYNKRDLPDVMTVDELQAALNPKGLPHFEAVAVDGGGVFDTLKCVIKMVLDKARKRTEVTGGSGAETPAREAAPRPAPAQPAPEVPAAQAPPAAPPQAPAPAQPAPVAQTQPAPAPQPAPVAQTPPPAQAPQPAPVERLETVQVTPPGTNQPAQPAAAQASQAPQPAPVERLETVQVTPPGMDDLPKSASPQQAAPLQQVAPQQPAPQHPAPQQAAPQGTPQAADEIRPVAAALVANDPEEVAAISRHQTGPIGIQKPETAQAPAPAPAVPPPMTKPTADTPAQAPQPGPAPAMPSAVIPPAPSLRKSADGPRAVHKAKPKAKRKKKSFFRKLFNWI